MLENSETLPDFLAMRSKQRTGTASFNIEMGLTTQQKFNANSSELATSGGGGAVGGSGVLFNVTETGGGGGGGEGGCFLGNTLVSLWDRRTPIIELYEWKQREPEVVFETVTFTDTGEKVRGIILDVFRYSRINYLHVTFADYSADDVAPQHRYWTGEMYAPIETLLNQYVVTETGESLRVIGLDKIRCDKGIFVYNVAIKGNPNYCANGRRVHNRKREPE